MSADSNQKKREFRRDAFYERNHFFVPGNNVVVAFRIKGNIEEAALKQAVEKARIKHPLIGARIEFDSENRGWFILENTPENQIIVKKRQDDKTWMQAVLNEYQHCFSISSGPLIRFIFVRDTSQSELVAFAHHAVCDGLSLVFLLRDVIQFLQNPSQSVEKIDTLPTIASGYNLSTIKINPIIQNILNRYNLLWKAKKIRLSESDFAPVHAYFSEQAMHTALFELNPSLTEKLIERCHKEHVSVNSALYCAVIRVQQDLQGDKEKFRRRILMPINIRAFLTPPPTEEVGLFAGGEVFEKRIKSHGNFWHQVRRVHKILEKHNTPQSMFAQAKKMQLMDPSIMDVRSMLFLGSILPHPSEKYQEILNLVESDRFLRKMKAKIAGERLQIGTVLTNIGRLNISNIYNDLSITDVYFVPPSSVVAEKIIGVNTFNGVLRGTFIFSENIIKVDVAEKFTHQLEKVLSELSLTV